MKKNILRISLLSIIVLVAILVSSFYLHDSPRKIVQKYLNLLKNNQFETAYDCISNIDKSQMSYDNFIKRYHFDETQRKVFLSHSTYEVYKTEITGNIATVFIKKTAPDIETMSKSMAEELLPLIMSAAFSKNKEEGKKFEKTFTEKLTKAIEDKNTPYITTEETMETIKENGKWHINLNIKKNNEINKLFEEAKQYEKEKKLNKAKEKYNEIMILQGNAVETEIESKIEKLDEEISAFEEKQAYIKNIILKNVKVFDYKEYSWSNTEKAFKGVIVNSGDKTLKEVEITVYMYDKENNIIAEEKFYPVTSSYFEENKPFKPKFVKDFGWKLTKYAPTGWSGKIKVEVTDINFQ